MNFTAKRISLNLKIQKICGNAGFAVETGNLKPE